MNIAGYEIEQRVLRGENSVYPGHPVTLGLLLMENYPDLDSALVRTSHGFPHALGNENVPGAGSEVYGALDLLKSIRDGVHTPAEAVEYAKSRWHAGGIPANVIPGQEQADRFADDFIARAGEWLAPSPLPSP